MRWKDAAGKEHITFGHTPYFRLPYRTTPGAANRAARTDDPRWDMAQAVFGRTPQLSGPGAKSRVSVEDGILTAGASNAYDAEPTRVVLGTPKPTTYQHYLVQEADDKADAIHWDDQRAILRGHKLYWHRPGAPFKPALEKQKKYWSVFRKAKRGAKFTACIRYENLHHQELGAILAALELPQECAHHLGMGKPLGFGSFRVNRVRLWETKREQRYSRLFAQFGVGEGILATGCEAKLADEVKNFKDQFAGWVLDDESTDQALERLWDTPRMKELKALLLFKDPPENPPWLSQQQWWDATRYLQCAGRLRNNQRFRRNNKHSYNEYQYTYKPGQDGDIDETINPRRPLPPATQVREGGPDIPKDPPPDQM